MVLIIIISRDIWLVFEGNVIVRFFQAFSICLEVINFFVDHPYYQVLTYLMIYIASILSKLQVIKVALLPELLVIQLSFLPRAKFINFHMNLSCYRVILSLIPGKLAFLHDGYMATIENCCAPTLFYLPIAIFNQMHTRS